MAYHIQRAVTAVTMCTVYHLYISNTIISSVCANCSSKMTGIHHMVSMVNSKQRANGPSVQCSVVQDREKYIFLLLANCILPIYLVIFTVEWAICSESVERCHKHCTYLQPQRLRSVTMSGHVKCCGLTKFVVVDIGPVQNLYTLLACFEDSMETYKCLNRFADTGQILSDNQYSCLFQSTHPW